jgi:hypothetical protein
MRYTASTARTEPTTTRALSRSIPPQEERREEQHEERHHAEIDEVCSGFQVESVHSIAVFSLIKTLAVWAGGGIEDVTISIPKGHLVLPLTEGSRYLGFIFSRAATPAEAEASLRRAHALLDFAIP